MLSQSSGWPSQKITDFKCVVLFCEGLNLNDALEYFFKSVSASKAKLALKLLFRDQSLNRALDVAWVLSAHLLNFITYSCERNMTQ